MKKITLLTIMSFSATCLFSQAVNEPANWPNTDWTVSGTYNSAGLLNDPTINDAFTFDDDGAGSTSDDDIVAESQVIDLTAAANAAENLLLFTGAYNHRDIGGTLDLEYWDADASTWNSIFDFVGNGSGSDYENCTNMQPYEAGLDIAGFSSTQLSGFKYRFAYDDADGWQWGFCIQDPVLISTAPSPPNCDSTLTNPLNGATDVNEDEDLTWSAASNFPTGYKITMGTSSGANDVIDNLDVGNVLTYDPGTLDFATTYYVTITPYGSSGDATGCAEESFTTRDDPNVIVDCDSAPVNTTYCYVNNDTMQFNFTSSSGFPLNILFNAGQVENDFDEVIILDSDGVTDLNAATPYGNGGDLTGIMYTSSGDNLTVIIQSDGSVNCQGNGYTPWDFDVWCQTCTPQTVDFLINGNCESMTPEFTVDVDISDLGTATSITVTDDQGNDEQVATAIGILTFGPYPADSEVVLTVANTDDANCIITSAPLTFICPPPPNECSIIYAGEDTTVDCENPSAELTASFMTNGIDTSVYEINALDACPIPPTTGGNPTGIDIDDRWSDPIDLSFEFCFFGNTYDQVVVGANGLVTFDLSRAGEFCPWSFTASVPSPNLPLNSIYGAYHDIDPSVCGNIEYVILGSAPSRQFVINFTNTCQFSCNDLESSQQIILYESSNNIDVNIIDKPTCASWNNGNAVIGVQDASGTTGYTPPNRNTGPWTASNEFWRFAPGGDPSYVFEWFEGDTSLGNSETITVTPTQNTTYTASVSYILCDGSTETITDDVAIELTADNITITQPDNLEECEDNTDGFLPFDLTEQDTTILSGLTDYSVSYYETPEDAENGVNEITAPNAYTNIANPQTVYARVEKNNSPSCFDTISFELIVTSCVFPQGISPNNDGRNDSFDLSDYEVSSLEIFNRNGLLVYSKKDYSNEWRGQSSGGEDLPVGTYFYVMRYRQGIERSSWIYINR